MNQIKYSDLVIESMLKRMEDDSKIYLLDDRDSSKLLLDNELREVIKDYLMDKRCN